MLSRPWTAVLLSSLHNSTSFALWEVGETAGEHKHFAGRAEAELSGTCGVYDVSVGLRSTAGLHADTHILPL